MAMELTEKRLVGPLTLTTTDVTRYTVPANRRTTVREIILSNYSGAPVRAAVHVVESGGAVADNRLVVPSLEVPAYGLTIIRDVRIVMAAGDFISGRAGAATAINLTVTGVERSLT